MVWRMADESSLSLKITQSIYADKQCIPCAKHIACQIWKINARQEVTRLTAT
jgi:hypothetical protein